MWHMVVDPIGNLFLSALMAAVPIMFLFWALAFRRMKGHWAALIAVVIAFAISSIGYGMPTKYALLSVINGCLFGLFPVCWIVITALLIFNMSVKTGQFEVIKNSLASISDDRRMQALLIAFSFGAFLEGAAGFGTPVAITAAMLIGLGFNPLYAAGLCLLANTAPVAFGAIGIPIIVGASVSGVNEMALSQLVGRTLPFLSLLVPLYLTILMAGWKKGLEVWPACLVSGASFATVQFLSSNYLGPLLPDILSSIASIICTVLFLRYWHPKDIWRFPEEPLSQGKARLLYTGGQVFRAWAPFIILSLFVATWGIKPVNQALNQVFNLFMQSIGFKGQVFTITGLDQMVIDDLGRPKQAVFNLNILSATGTSILLAWLFCIPVMGASVGTALSVAYNTIRQLKWPIFTISTIFGFAYIMNFSGMAITLGYALAKTGLLFPFFAAFLGWLGVFMTGSDTSTNALFGRLQAITAQKIGIDPLITVSANTCGGICGKMISPQSLSVATGAIGLVGREAEIFRFTLSHSIILTFVVASMSMLWAYVFPGIVPVAPEVVQRTDLTVTVVNSWHVTFGNTIKEVLGLNPTINPSGISYLIIAIIVIVFVTVLARIVGKGGTPTAPGKDVVSFH